VDFTVVPLTLAGFDDLPPSVRRCVYWEVDPETVGSVSLSDPEFEKEAWLSMVMLQWGSCAQIVLAHRDGLAKVVGSAFYAPPSTVPRARTFPTGPVSADAVLLSWAGVDPGIDPAVLEDLITAVCTDLVLRGVRAVEAFALLTPVGQTTADVLAVIDRGPCGCPTVPLIDADFLESVGFETVAPHHRFPRMRLELSEGLGWKAGVERALEQLLAASAAEAQLVPSAPNAPSVAVCRVHGRLGGLL
jgi:hypothetical protein